MQRFLQYNLSTVNIKYYKGDNLYMEIYIKRKFVY